MATWPVIGHEWAIDLLIRAITGPAHTGGSTDRRLSHAYLFTGPAQVGKTTLARAFAQALLCETQTGTPCGACRACQRIAAGRYPDVQFITAEKNTIQIDQVRALRSDAALSPLEGAYRIFIIREIERASPPAANALLKTLEEPPPQVILLLTSARRDQLLPTILSRCQIIGLRPLPLGQIQTALETHWAVDPQRAALLARLSSGRLGWAVNAHTDPELWPARAKSLDDLLALAADGYLGRLAYAETLSRQGDAIERTLELWATWWRDVLLVQRGLPADVVNLDRRVQLAQQAELYRSEQVEAALNDLIQTLRRLKANVNARLALDVLALRLPRPAVV
ncbi:MAG: DNA polymerase III subunit delta' [Chloroflexi bacterium HGW-Chloroflexi-1]|nr:MAG: DNA polymerase III subunit delta' [Chloroflexi bacterium HGW-Chloroflexi-1]